MEIKAEEREALVELADALHDAAMQANAIERVAGGDNVYGDASRGVVRILALLWDIDYPLAVEVHYNLFIDSGMGVREALAYVERHGLNQDVVGHRA